MKAVLFILVGLLLAGAVLFFRPEQVRSEENLTNDNVLAPAVFSSPINGGCYIAAPNDCRIHVDPFTINIATGTRLDSFRLQANGVTIYDFRTDVSNPPPSTGSTYSPSLVMQDFAAKCGETYTVNILGKDSGDPNFLNMGQFMEVTCPAAVP